MLSPWKYRKQGPWAVCSETLTCHILSFLATTVNGSSFSKRSFLEWIRGGIFIPVEGVKVEIGEVEHCSTLPEPTCNECIKKWEASGLQKDIKDIKWHLMRQLSDIRGLVCS